ncbi:MAG: 1-acyl-sn-glycerol-3-phosphate acyltransferase [Lachnospiraceae bacterium]|nr:1-acyl-sn-glycerol-3-phosphate acyltransferase [Lachnospiraceae bacterium]
MIRLILVLLFVVIFLIVSLPIQLVEYIIGKSNKDLKDRSSLAIVNWAFRVVLFLSGTSVTVLGEENVPKDEAVLYVGNHKSYYDIIMTYVRVPRPTGYMAKVEMLRYPSLSTWMKYLHCIFLDRSNIKAGMKSILDAIDKVKSGISICIFPEGTRNRTSEMFLEFHDGSFKIAEKSGCPIVPISINNANAIFEDHIPRIKKAHVVIEYGKPIYTRDLSKEEKRRLSAMVQEVIKTNYLKNEELVNSLSNKGK